MLWEGPAISCSLPPLWVWMLCVCPVPLAGLSPSPPVQERSEEAQMPAGRKEREVRARNCVGCLTHGTRAQFRMAASWVASRFVAMMPSSLLFHHPVVSHKVELWGWHTSAANLQGALNLQRHKKSEGFFFLFCFLFLLLSLLLFLT